MSKLVNNNKGMYFSINDALQAYPKDEQSRLGTLIFGELINCQNFPNNKIELEEIMTKASVAMNVTIVNKTFHEFNPHGLSGVIVLAESHFSIHTWPEYNVVAIDIFGCGPINWRAGIESLTKDLDCKNVDIVEVPRGINIKT